MSQTPELPSPERLAQIREDVSLADALRPMKERRAAGQTDFALYTHELLAALDEAEFGAHNIEARLLAAHDRADAREAQIREALTGLLLHSLEKLPANSPYRELGEACNASVRNTAKALGITL